jgi:hypothetical protein
MTKRSGTNQAMIVLGLLVVFVAIAMFLGAFGISVHRILWGPFAGDHHILRIGPVFGLLGLGTLLQIFLAFWVGMDANRRGMNGLLWGLLVLFTFVVGLLVYLIVAQTSGNGTRERPAPALPTTVAAGGGACPRCGEGVDTGFKVCPFCGASLAPASPSCPSCARPAKPEWKVCPYCSTGLKT